MLLIFDLDGVLVETKDIHFKALNNALSDFGEIPISYTEHIYKYDGKSTRDKLDLRGITKDKSKQINDRKQYYTKEMLKDEIKENDKFKNIFKLLKEQGNIIHVASNSIRDTIELVLKKLGVYDYVDFIISNEEVKNGKPNSEMYLKCMINAEKGPKDTLIIEDSYVGRQAAYNSGAHLLGVKNPYDVTYEAIKMELNKCMGEKSKWKSDINIVIPMAGAGSRFTQVGYTFPKPLIDVKGKPMIQVVVENINIEGHYIFIVRKEHYDTYNLKALLDIMVPGCSIITVDRVTEGAACTVLLAKDIIDNNKPLLIVNSDQFIQWDSSHCMYSFQSSHIDGGILVFENSHPKWSYAKIDGDNFVQEIKENTL